MIIKKTVIKGGWAINSIDYNVVLSKNNRHFLRVYNGNNGNVSHLPLDSNDLEFAHEIADNFNTEDAQRAMALAKLAGRIMNDRYGI